MATYAHFETFEELHRGTLVTVWKARGSRGGDTTEFGIKVFRLGSEGEEGAESSADLPSFEEVVAELRSLEQQGAQQWVSVVSSGKQTDEAFWVTHLYPRSLQTVLDRRALLPPEDIHWIAVSVARALGELQTHLKRPHGNLKASNIFIKGEGRLRGLPVVLSDMKPRSALVLPGDQVADFRELGRLIVLIVRRRPADMRKPIGWPIEEGVEWKRFGRQGAAWREFCNGLLNPNPAPADLDWDKVGERLKALTPRQGRPLRWVAVGGLTLAAVAGGFSYLRFCDYEALPRSMQAWASRVGNVPKDVTTVPPEWAQLCLAYKAWLGGFASTLSRKDTSLAWSPYLKERVVGELTELMQAYGSLDPRKLAKDQPKNAAEPDLPGDLLTLATDPPDIVKKGEIVHRVVEVARAAQKASQALDDWPERRKLEETRQRFTQQGWRDVAAQLQGAYERSGTAAAVNGEPKDVVAGISDVVKFGELATNAENLWKEVEQRGQVLAGAGDPVMKGIVAHLRARAVGSADLKALNGSLSNSIQDAKEWLAAIQGSDGQSRLDRPRFVRESTLSNFSGEVTAEVIAQWKLEVQQFQYVADSEDPRRKPDWTALFRKIDASLAQLREEERSTPPGATAQPAGSGRFQQMRDETRRTLDGMLANRLVRKDLEGAAPQVQSVVAGIDALNEQVLAALAQLRPDPAGWISRVRQNTLGAEGSALRREWTRRLDQLLTGANPAALAQNNVEFRALRERQRVLEQFFTVLTGPRGVAAFPVFDPQGIAEELVPPLKSWAGGRIERATSDWLSAVAWSGVVPASTAEAFVDSDAARRVVDRLTADFREAAELAADFSAAADRLAQGFGLEDPAVGKVAKWSSRPLLAELGTAAVFRGVMDAGATLDSVRIEQRRDTLVATAGASALSIALAGWRRLGELPNWPTPGELETEGRLVAGIAQRIDKFVREPARRTALQAEVAAEKVRRWRVALTSATDDSILGQVLAKRTDFGVEMSQLKAGEKFNVELQRLKKLEWRNLAEDRIVAQRDAAVSGLRTQLGEQIPTQISQWLQSLLDLVLIDQAGGQSDLRKLGPGAVGWTAEISPDSRLVTYRRTLRGQEHQLNFVFVDHEGAVPFFLGATEMSAGLMIDLANDPATGAKLKGWLTEAAGDTPESDPRNGPRVWKLDRRHLVQRADRWTGVPLPTWPAKLYAPEIKDPVVPERDSPIQYLPPAAALYLARDVLGCRLPSREEWQTLVESSIAEKSSDPSTGPNYRDAMWLKERDYLLAANVADLPIDADIFWPSTVTLKKRGGQAQAVTDRNDGLLWFATTEGGTGQTPRLRHLLGNVAEYLFDETTKQFFVAGGSALSPPDVDPTKPYPVDLRLASEGFSDVGLRLAFNAPGGVAGRSRLQQLVRNQPFLRP